MAIETETKSTNTELTNALASLGRRIRLRSGNCDQLEEKSGESLKAEKLWEGSGVPKRHAASKELSLGRWSATLEWIRGELGKGFTMALVGDRGTGKTQLGIELIRASTESLVRARYTTAMEIFMMIKASYKKDSPETEISVMSQFAKPRLLIIDEVQERAETPWEDRLLTHLIDKRYRDIKDTLIISNLKGKEFDQCVGLSVVSRCNEMGGIIDCDWKGFRGAHSYPSK